MTDDWGLMENWDEDCYCSACDTSFSQDDMVIVPVGQWAERYGCPNCGDVPPKACFNDLFYLTGYYLLSIADEDYVAVSWYIPLPKYES